MDQRARYPAKHLAHEPGREPTGRGMPTPIVERPHGHARREWEEGPVPVADEADDLHVVAVGQRPRQVQRGADRAAHPPRTAEQERNVRTARRRGPRATARVLQESQPDDARDQPLETRSEPLGRAGHRGCWHVAVLLSGPGYPGSTEWILCPNGLEAQPERRADACDRVSDRQSRPRAEAASGAAKAAAARAL